MAERSDELRTSASEDPAAIRAEIEDTRARMSDTLDELGERLNPQVVKERVKDSIREATLGRVEDMARKTKERLDDTSLTLMETIRENPVPAAIMAVGLGWLIVNGGRRRSQSDRHVALARFDDDREQQDWYRGGTRRMDYGEELDEYEQGESYGMESGYAGSAYSGSERGDRGVRGRASELAHTVREKADDLAHRAQDVAGRAGERVRETAGHVSERARETAGRVRERARDTAGRVGERARDVAHRTSERTRDVASNVAETSRRQARRVEDMYYENPIGVGLAVAAAGFAVGLGTPRTDVETRLVGDQRDQIVDRVKEVARDKKDKVQHVAERVIDEGKRTAKDALRDEGLMGGGTSNAPVS